jgi:hypothetical protein
MIRGLSGVVLYRMKASSGLLFESSIELSLDSKEMRLL